MNRTLILNSLRMFSRFSEVVGEGFRIRTQMWPTDQTILFHGRKNSFNQHAEPDFSVWGSLGPPEQHGYIFPFLLCFSHPFFSQRFVTPPQTAILLFCISFSWGWSWFLSLVQCHEPPSIVHQALCLSF